MDLESDINVDWEFSNRENEPHQIIRGGTNYLRVKVSGLLSAIESVTAQPNFIETGHRYFYADLFGKGADRRHMIQEILDDTCEFEIRITPYPKQTSFDGNLDLRINGHQIRTVPINGIVR